MVIPFRSLHAGMWMSAVTVLGVHSYQLPMHSASSVIHVSVHIDSSLHTCSCLLHTNIISQGCGLINYST